MTDINNVTTPSGCLLLIDNRVADYQEIINAKQPGVQHLVFNVDDTNRGASNPFEYIQTQISELGVSAYTCVGLVQHNIRMPRYSMFGQGAYDTTTQAPAAPDAIIAGVETSDPTLQTWSGVAGFITALKTTYGIQNFDMMACALYSDPNWKYIIDALTAQTGVTIRASTDDTGAAGLGGDWFLESHTGVNLKGVYFTEAIEEYRGVLYVGSDNWDMNGSRRRPMKSFAVGGLQLWGHTGYGGTNNRGVSLSSQIVGISSSGTIFRALKTDGSVVVWGAAGDDGDYGTATYSNTVVPTESLTSGVIDVITNHLASAALKSDGSVVIWGRIGLGGTNNTSVNISSQVVDVYPSCDGGVFAALKNNGSVVCWGSLNDGGSTTSPFNVASSLTSGIVAVYANGYSFAAINISGGVVTWGNSTSGGNSSSVSGSLTSGVVAIYSLRFAQAALKNNGSLVIWGDTNYGGASPGLSVSSDVIHVYPKGYGSFALKTDGSVIGWGNGTYIGSTPTLTNVVTICSNFYASAALKSDGSVLIWGDPLYGGAARVVTDSTTYTNMVGDLSSGVIALYSTYRAFAALKSNGSVVTWGNFYYGANSSTVATGSLTSGVVSIRASSNSFSALKSNGSVIMWGNSGGGGTNNTSPSVSSGVTDVYNNSYAFAALKPPSTPSYDLSMSYYTEIDRLDILRSIDYRRTVNLTANSNRFTLSSTRSLQKFNYTMPTNKPITLIVPDYQTPPYSLTSTITLPTSIVGSNSMLITSEIGERVNITGVGTYVNYGTYVYKVESNGSYTKTTSLIINSIQYDLYGGDGVYSSGIALVLGFSNLSAITGIITGGGFVLPTPISNVLTTYGTTWNQLGADIDGEAANDWSGYSVNMSADGTVVAIGAPQNNGSINITYIGHVRVYKYTPGKAAVTVQTDSSFGPVGWTRLGSDIDGEYINGSESGTSVSLSADGTIVAIGAFKNNDGTNYYCGHVRVYKYTPGKGESTNQNDASFGPIGWTRLGADIDGEAQYDRSGISVSLSADGTVVAIGAYDNDGSGNLRTDSGHVRVYKYTPSKTVAITNQNDVLFGPVGWTRLGADIDGETAGDNSGWSVSLSADGTIVAIAARYNDGSGYGINDNRGHVRVYKYNPNKTVEQLINQALTTFGPAGWDRLGADIDGEAAGDYSGWRVSLSADGTTVAIKAIYNDGSGNLRTDSGHVRVYKYNPNKTVEQLTNQALTTFGPAGWDRLGADIDGEAAGDGGGGSSVSLSADGTIVAIGAGYNDGTTGDVEENRGHVQVYKYNPNKTVAQLTNQSLSTFGPAGWDRIGADIDGKARGDDSGTSVSLSADGTTVAIGAVGSDGPTGTADYCGHVRVYKIDTYGNYTYTSNNTAIADIFGNIILPKSVGSTTITVTQSASGSYTSKSATVPLTIGFSNLSAITGSITGGPFVIPTPLSNVLTTYGTTWNQLGSDIIGKVTGDESGTSLSVSADGTIVAIGARSNTSNRGTVRVYKYNDISWNQLGSDINGETSSDYSGQSVSLSANGRVVAIGANMNDGSGNLLPDSGQVRVYEFNGSSWVKRGGDIYGEANADQSGYSVSLSADGNTVAIGAIMNDGSGNALSNSGHVRVYKYNSSKTAPQLTNQNLSTFGPAGWDRLGADIDGEAVNDQSGFSVSLSADGTIVAIGAIFNDGTSGTVDTSNNQGHVRIYKYNSSKTEPQLTNQSLSTYGPAGWDRMGSDIDEGESLVYENYGPITIPTYTVTGFPILNNYTTWDIDISFTTTVSGTWRGLLGSMRNSVEDRGWGIWISGTNGIHFSTKNYYYDITTIQVSPNVAYTLNVKKTVNSLVIKLTQVSSQVVQTGNVTLTTDVLGVGPVSIGGWLGIGNWTGYQYTETFSGTISYVLVTQYRNNNSGFSVGLSANGTTVAIGSPLDDTSGVSNSGRVRVFAWNGTAWGQRGGNISGVNLNENVGDSVSLSADGSILSVSSFTKVINYNYNSSTNTWSQIGANVTENTSNILITNALTYNPLVYLDATNPTSYSSGTWTNLGSLGGNVDMTRMNAHEPNDNGGAFYFNGAANHGKLNISSTTLTSLTYIAVVKVSGPQNNKDQTVIAFGSDYVRFLFYQSSTNISFENFASGTISSGYIVTPGVWYLLSVTVSTNGNVVFYVNGVPVLYYTSTNFIVNKTNTYFDIGAELNVSTGTIGREFAGKISSIAIYNRVLTSAEILNIYNSRPYQTYKVNLSSQGNIVAIGAREYDGVTGTSANIGVTRVYKIDTSGNYTYTSGNSAIADICGNIVLPKSVGSTTITVTQSASGSYTSKSATVPLTIFTIINAPPTINTWTIADVSFSVLPFSLTPPSSNSSGGFGYQSSNTAVATVSGSTVTVKAAGQTTITATQDACGNYLSGTITGTLTVNPIAPTITQLTIADVSFGVLPFSLTPPTSDSSGGFSYQSSNISVATVSGNTLTVVGAGQSIITATQDACGNYLSGTRTGTLTVNPIAPIINTWTIADVSFGVSPFSLTRPTSDSSGGFGYQSSNISVATVSGNTLTVVGAGQTTITATQDACGNFTTRTITAVLVVSPIKPTIGALIVPAKNFGDISFNLQVPTTDSSGAFIYSSSDPTVATITSGEGRVTLLKVGTTIMTATQDACGNFSGGSVSASLVVSASLSNFTVPTKKSNDVAFDLTNPTATDTITGFTFSSSNHNVATIGGAGGRTVSIIGIGSTVITARQAATVTHGELDISATFVVSSPAPVTPVITLAPIIKAYGNSSFRLVPSSTNTDTSGGNVFSFFSRNNAVVSLLDASLLRINGIGTTTIDITQAASENFTDASGSVVITVNKGASGFSGSTFIVATNKTYGDAAFPVSNIPSSSSNGTITYSSNDTSIATIDNSGIITPLGFGIVNFTATQAESDLYTIDTKVSNNLSVARKTVALTRVTPSGSTITKTYGDVNFSVSATNESNGAFLFSSSDNSIATVNVSSGVVQIVTAGTVTISASRTQTAQYTSTPVSWTLQISRTTTTLSGLTSITRNVTVAPFTVTASSASNGAVSYALQNSTSTVLTINPTSGLVTLLSPGSAVIVASQAQGTSHEAPSSITATIEVTAAGNTLQGATLTSSSNFSNVNLNGASLANSNITNTNFSSARLGNSNFNNSIMSGAIMTGADLSGTTLDTANITNTNFSSANLRNTILNNSTITGSNMTSADLSGASLTTTNITNTNFSSAKLNNANLNNSVISGSNMTSAELSGARMNSATITGTNFTSAILLRVDLSNANVRNSIFNGADLSGSTLTYIDASGASFTNANLKGANLSNAVFTNANMTNANISGANISNVTFSENQKLQLLKNTENRAITQIQVSQVIGSTVLSTLSADSAVRGLPNVASTMFKVIIPNTSLVASETITDVILDITNFTYFYFPIGENEYFQIEGVKYYINGTTVRNYATNAVVENSRYGVKAIKLIAGSLTIFVNSLNTLYSSSLVVPSNKINTDAPFNIIGIPTSNSPAPIVYTSTNTNIATIDPTTGLITLQGTSGYVRFIASQVVTETYQSASITSNELFVNRLIDLTLPGLNQTFSLSTLATLDASSITSETTDATAVFYVRLSDMTELFQYQTDSIDINDISASDLKYYVFHRNFPDSLKLNPSHAMMNKAESSGMFGMGEGFASNKSLVKHDFIRYIALRLFNTIHGVDLMSNETDLLENMTYLGETVRNNINLILSGISTTSSSGTMAYDASGNKYLTNDASGNTNLSRELMRQIAANEPSRLYNNSVNNTGLRSVPLRENDSILFKLTITSATGQNILTGVSIIPSRTYTIKLVLKNTVNSVTNANTVVIDSDMYPNSYAYSTSVVTYAPTSDSSGVYNIYSPPAPIPFSRFGYNGWYYTNSTAWVNVASGVRDRVKWIVPANTAGSSTVSELRYIRINMKVFNKTSLPYLIVYTQAGSYRKYNFATPNSLVNGTVYSFYMNFNSYSREPAAIGSTNAILTYSGVSGGSFANNEVITSIAVESDNSAAAGSVEFTLANIVVGEVVSATSVANEKEYGFSAIVHVSYP